MNVWWRWRLMVRYGRVPYRGWFIGKRADPCDRLRILAGHWHLVVSWLPYSKSEYIGRQRRDEP